MIGDRRPVRNPTGDPAHLPTVIDGSDRSIPRTPSTAYRRPERTRVLIAAIAEAKEGLTHTHVVVNAVELYARQALGRRIAELTLVEPRQEPRMGETVRRRPKVRPARQAATPGPVRSDADG